MTIGEVHSDLLSHHVEFEIVRTLADLRPNLAIGMECFYRQHQEALDRFIFIHGSMGTLKNETNWSESWYAKDANNVQEIS